MKLTFTKLDTYKACPLRFRLKYQAKLPEAPLRSRNLSLILHRSLQAFLFQARRDPSLNTLLRTYENHCPQPQDLKQQQRYQEGRQALEAFHREQGDRLATAVALEQDFLIDVAGIEIAGRLDCALETEAGLELLDFKFTSQVPASLDSLQLQLYALGRSGPQSGHWLHRRHPYLLLPEAGEASLLAWGRGSHPGRPKAGERLGTAAARRTGIRPQRRTLVWYVQLSVVLPDPAAAP
jgi:RecB family exonuclease